MKPREYKKYYHYKDRFYDPEEYKRQEQKLWAQVTVGC